MALLWICSNIFWCVKRPQRTPSPTLFPPRQAADAPVIVSWCCWLTWRWLSDDDTTECNMVESQSMKFRFLFLSSCTRHSGFWSLSFFYPISSQSYHFPFPNHFPKHPFCPFLLSLCHFLLLTDFSPTKLHIFTVSVPFFYHICLPYLFPLYCLIYTCIYHVDHYSQYLTSCSFQYFIWNLIFINPASFKKMATTLFNNMRYLKQQSLKYVKNMPHTFFYYLATLKNASVSHFFITKMLQSQVWQSRCICHCKF